MSYFAFSSTFCQFCCCCNFRLLGVRARLFFKRCQATIRLNQTKRFEAKHINGINILKSLEEIVWFWIDLTLKPLSLFSYRSFFCVYIFIVHFMKGVSEHYTGQYM